MVHYTKRTLGQIVRDLRESQGTTQEELGRTAGYGKGAGVSISRLEHGLVQPSPERLTGIAKALGTTPEELEAQAAEQPPDDDATMDPKADREIRDALGSRAGGIKATPSSKELRARANKIQHEIEERTAVITALGDEFNTQHDRARDGFFMKFVEVAARVEGAPQPDPAQLEDEEATDAETVAAYRLRLNTAGVGQLLAGGAGGAAAGAAAGSAAYGTLVAAASLGTASTGAATLGLWGVAATNASLTGTLAAGGAGIAGGTMLLAGIVAPPVLLLSVVGLLLIAKRNRKQQQKLAEQLKEAEAELAATRPGYEALLEILPRAADALDYIATHAGHALGRWSEQLGSGLMTWESIGNDQQERYLSFVDIAAAQVTIVTINVQGLLTTRGGDQEDLIELADKLLTQSRRTVTSNV